MRSRKPSKASLRSKDAFTLRRCQILLASSRGEHAPRIAHSLGCGQQTVREAIHEFNQRGLGMLSGPDPRAPKEPVRPSTKRAPRLLGRCSTALGGSSDRTL
jgi:Winged helix-turn helix